MKNQLKWGTILSYIQMSIKLVINLLFTPIMIRELGSSEYGLYNTVSSTISMLSVLSLGFYGSYIRYYSKYKSQDDEDSISKLNGLFLTIFSAIGMVAFLCGLFLSFNLDIVFENGLTAKEYEIARALMLLLTVNLAVSFPLNVFGSIISAHERYIFLKIVNMIRTICGPLVSIPLLLMGYRSVVMVSVLVCFYLIADLLLLYYALFKLRVKISFGKLEAGLFKSLLVYTAFIAINMIVDQVNWNLGKVLLGRFRGTTAVSIYSVGYTIATSYNMFSTSISGVFTPRIHRIINTVKNAFERRESLTELFVRVGRVQFLILALVSSGIVFYGKSFITEFFAGNAYSDSYYVTLLLILPGNISLIQNLGVEIQRGLNRHKFGCLVYLFMAIINIGISVILCQKIGAVGSAIGTAVSMIVANGIIMNIYYHKKCDIDIILFWKNIISMLKGLIVPIIFGIISQYLFNTKSIFGFVSSVVCYTGVYIISMWFMVMNDYEKQLVIVPMKKVFKRLR